MPDQVLPGFQLDGETFLLTFPFIEPNVQALAETQRNSAPESADLTAERLSWPSLRK